MIEKNTHKVVIVTQEEGLVEVEKYGFPVIIQSSFVLGGWKEEAENGEAFKSLLADGFAISPIHEVMLTWRGQLSPAAFEIFKKLEPFYPPDPWGKTQWKEGGFVYHNGWLDLRKKPGRDQLERQVRETIAMFVEMSAGLYLKEKGTLKGFDREPYPTAVMHQVELLFILRDLDFQVETGDFVD